MESTALSAGARYNMVFTSVPIFIVGSLDVDVYAPAAFAIPKLYFFGVNKVPKGTLMCLCLRGRLGIGPLSQRQSCKFRSTGSVSVGTELTQQHPPKLRLVCSWITPGRHCQPCRRIFWAGRLGNWFCIAHSRDHIKYIQLP